MQKTAKGEINLTVGPLFKKLLMVALPLIGTNILQLLFNAADVAVVSIFRGEESMAAVGATNALIQLIVNLFIGLGAGASVVLAKLVGQNNLERSRKLVGTAVFLSLILGVILLFVGAFGARTFLVWMNCDPILLDKATTYLTIYFLGMPIMMLYNFCAGILRAVGDTLRPMLFLLISGAANVGLNVFFVLVCGMDVEGVAIATVVSQGISAALSLLIMVKGTGFSKLSFKHFRIYKQELVEIIKVGLPSGIQASMFSISNVLIQSTINTYGAMVMAGNTAAIQFEGFVCMAGNSVAIANMSLVSQNYGARDKKRIIRSIIYSVLTAVVIDFLLAGIIVLFANQLCSIMTDMPEVIEIAKIRLTIMCLTFFLGATMDTLTYTLRSLGKSTTAMVISIFFVCVFRIVWLNTFYLLNPTYAMIFYSYPISWLMCTVVNLFFLIPTIKKVKPKEQTA